MFGRLFGKKPPPDEAWSVATAEDNGRPLIIRFRSASPPGTTPAAYPHLLVVQWKYGDAIGSGMPLPDVKKRMDTLEILLERALEPARAAYNTGVVTGNGIREWQWYARDPGEAMRLVNTALSGQPVFPVEFIAQHDPTWSAYERLRSGAP